MVFIGSYQLPRELGKVVLDYHRIVIIIVPFSFVTLSQMNGLVFVLFFCFFPPSFINRESTHKSP
jgi:hypothetical protein